MTAWSDEIELESWIDHHVSGQRGTNVKPFMDWNGDLVFQVLVSRLNASDSNNGLAWTVASDDQDIALSALHLDIFSLIQGQNKMRIFQGNLWQNIWIFD